MDSATLLADLSPELRVQVERALTGEPSVEELEAICDRLDQARAWNALHAVASRALAIAEGEDEDSSEAGPDEAGRLDDGPESAHVEAGRIPPRLPRFLVRAAEGMGDPTLSLAALATAHRILPRDPDLARRYGLALERAGEREPALEAMERAVLAFARSPERDGLDEVLLKLLESNAPGRLAAVFPSVASLLRQGEVQRIAPFLELASDILVTAEVRDIAWRELSRAAAELPANQAGFLATHLAALAHARHGEAATALLRASGLEPREGALPDALSQYEALARFAPGSYVEHGSRGVGRITNVEREAITVDFIGLPAQRITLAGAQRAVTPLAADDLRVLAAWQPDELARLRTEDPVALVARVLSQLGGEASVTEIKRHLVAAGGVATSDASSFWQGVKTRLAKDARIDAGHAFEQRYRLARPGTAAAVPEFPRRGPPRRALTLLRKLVRQRPEDRRAIAEVWGPGLLAWAGSGRVESGERVGSLIWAADLDPESPSARNAEERGSPILEAELEAGFDLGELPSESEQLRALAWGLAGSAWEKAVRSGLASRFRSIRDRAIRALVEHGAEGTSFLERLWLEPGAPSAAVLASLEHATESDSPVRAILERDPWTAVRGLVNALESTPEPAVIRRASALVAPGSVLVRVAQARPAPPDVETLLARRCLTWRTTERALEPILDLARHSGLAHLLERVEEARADRAAGAGTSEPKSEAERAGVVTTSSVGANYMTRATHVRLQREFESLESSLRTTIPVAIQRARELGDLRENAEYHAAKLKQSQAEARVLQIAQRIREAALIDDLVPEPGVAGPGTEVEIEMLPGTTAGGAERYWILGEGDDALGDNVVSYRSPAGRALVGRRENDEVSWAVEGHEYRARIRAVRVRKPPAAAAEPPPPTPEAAPPAAEAAPPSPEPPGAGAA